MSATAVSFHASIFSRNVATTRLLERKTGDIWQLIPLHRLENLLKRLAHDPRDLHLGNAEAAADLTLLQVVLETKPKHGALALCERGFLGGELDLHLVIAFLWHPHRLDHRHRFRVPAEPASNVSKTSSSESSRRSAIWETVGVLPSSSESA